MDGVSYCAGAEIDKASVSIEVWQCGLDCVVWFNSGIAVIRGIV